MEIRSCTGNPDRYDKPMAQGSGFSICQRTAGEHSLLPPKGGIDSVNRPGELVLSLPKETRMLVVDPVLAGVVWG